MVGPNTDPYTKSRPAFYAFLRNLVDNFDVEIDVRRPFMVVSLVSAYTNGQTDFFNTVKLEAITLDPAFTLTADDGGARSRSGDGTYA